MNYHPTMHDYPDFDFTMPYHPNSTQLEASPAGHRRRVTADDDRFISGAAAASVPPPRPDANDLIVVCGRGKGAYNRPGNKHFRALIRSHLQAYMEAPNKFQKGVIIQKVAQDVLTHGLVFVRKASDAAHEWTELDSKERRDKIGHAMREAVAEQKVKARKTRSPKHPSGLRESREAKQVVSGGSDSIISLTASLDDSDAADHYLEDRRSRFDLLLESFRAGRDGGGSDLMEPVAIEPESCNNVMPAIEPDFSTSLSFFPI